MRRSKKYLREVRPLAADRLMGGRSYEIGPGDFEYIVQKIPHAKKEYLCPGCGGIISIGEAHIVAWTEEGWFGKEAGQRDRRHWHTGCWTSRGRRQPRYW
ncbi:MAG: ATP/GTP-binding protein [Arcanobacterium sp.]|nr:ATP/GTP-binding protein [Arcanobacterium sp.]MDY5273774.1 ATP/GTP-binding protein [Arcanobacterium sp.]